MTVKSNRNSRKKQKLEHQKETTSVENRAYRKDFFVVEANELLGNSPFNIPVHISGFRLMKKSRQILRCLEKWLCVALHILSPTVIEQSFRPISMKGF